MIMLVGNHDKESNVIGKSESGEISNIIKK